MTLLVGLVMLVVLILLVVSAIRTSNSQLRTVGNVQAQNEAIAAAQQGVERLLGSVTNFTAPPATQTVNVDINGDGVTDYTATVETPACLQSITATGYSDAYDPSTPGGAASIAPQNTYWDIKATATDTRTGAVAAMHQGVRVLLPASATC